MEILFGTPSEVCLGLKASVASHTCNNPQSHHGVIQLLNISLMFKNPQSHQGSVTPAE